MMLYIENPKDATRKLLELINEFGKVALPGAGMGEGLSRLHGLLASPGRGEMSQPAVGARSFRITRSDNGLSLGARAPILNQEKTLNLPHVPSTWVSEDLAF